MRPLSLEDLCDREQYDRVRERYREAVIAHKQARRIAVGDKVTLVFEDRETLRFQVLEMAWIERTSSPEALQRELDVYNELLPRENELSATLFVEITDVAEIRPELERLIGLDEHVSLVLDDTVVHATFDPKQLDEERISAVQYIRFRLDPATATRFRNPDAPASIRIDHPNYRHSVEIRPDAREALIAGLDGEPEPLLPADAFVPAAPAGPELLFSHGRVRAVRPLRPRAPGHVIVEPIEPVPSLLAADAALLADCLAAIREIVAAHEGQGQACRVWTDIGTGDDGLCWHVVALPPE